MSKYSYFIDIKEKRVDGADTLRIDNALEEREAEIRDVFFKGEIKSPLERGFRGVLKKCKDMNNNGSYSYESTNHSIQPKIKKKSKRSQK